VGTYDVKRQSNDIREDWLGLVFGWMPFKIFVGHAAIRNELLNKKKDHNGVQSSRDSERVNIEQLSVQEGGQ